MEPCALSASTTSTSTKYLSTTEIPTTSTKMPSSSTTKKMKTKKPKKKQKIHPHLAGYPSHLFEKKKKSRKEEKELPIWLTYFIYGCMTVIILALLAWDFHEHMKED